MPLNQKQRDQITPYIEHFFYGLSSNDPTTLSGLKTAIEKPLTPIAAEQKEIEEKLTEAELEFRNLTHLIAAPQEKIKKIKIYHDSDKKDTHVNFEALNAEPTTVDDVIEYIIFYSLCCIQFHFQQSDNDDFNLNTWLLERGITEAELNAAWLPADWLKKIGTDKALAAHNWDINTTLALSNQHRRSTPYVTQLSAIDYGPGGLDWTLPTLKGRMYRAEIHPETRNRTDKAGKVIEVTATLDLHIDVYISPEKTLTEILTNFTPYPNVPATEHETDAERQTRDLRNSNLQNQAKENAAYHAEDYAITMIVNHLKKTGIAPPPKPVTLADLVLAESAALLASGKASPAESLTGSRSPLVRSLASMTLSNDHAEEHAEPDHLPPLPEHDLSSESDNESKIDSENEELSNHLYLIPVRPLTNIPYETDSESGSDSEYEDELGTDIEDVWLIEETVNDKAPGMRLLTYQYYFNEFKAGRLAIQTLESLTEDSVDALCNEAILFLIEHNHLDFFESLQLPPHVITLLKDSPHYLMYVCQNPDGLQRLKYITPAQSNFLRLPITTILLSQEKMLLQTALLVLPLAYPVFTNVNYANYLQKHPEVIPLLITLTLAQQAILLNNTLSNMIEREILTLATALKLHAIHLPIIINELYNPIFSTNKKAFVLLIGFSSKKIELLLHAQIIDLIKSGILPAEKAFSYTEEQLLAHTKRNTLILLRRKKISSHIVAQFNATHTQLVETEPYALLLREHTGPKPHVMLSASKESLDILLYQSVRNLISMRVITVEDILFATPKFLETFFGNMMQMLLIEKKITAKQVKRLSDKTIGKIEQDIEVYKYLANSDDNDNSKHYIPLKVWSREISKELIAAYQTETPAPETLYVKISETTRIIALGEKIPEDILRAEVIKLFIQYLAEQIRLKKNTSSGESIDAIYQTISETIDATMQAEAPNWPEAFATIATQAHEKINALSNTLFQTRLRPGPFSALYQSRLRGAVGLFSTEADTSQKNVTDFCSRLIHMAGFLQLAEDAPKPENTESMRATI
jgi:hypothetical protein